MHSGNKNISNKYLSCHIFRKEGGGVKNECRSRRPYKYFPLFYIKSSLLAGKTVFNLKMRNVHKQYALCIHKKLFDDSQYKNINKT